MAYSVTLPDIYTYYNNNWQLHYLYPTACGLIEMPNSNATTATQVGESLNTPASCSQVVKFINVPVIARYRLNLNKFNVYANLGVEFNFVTQERANVTINNTETTVVNSIDGLRSMNYGFLTGAGGQYNINKGIGIFMEVDYRRAITSLTENIPINCYPYSIGLNTGLTFHF
jgi:opacity protein-like surface antigen